MTDDMNLDPQAILAEIPEVDLLPPPTNWATLSENTDSKALWEEVVHWARWWASRFDIGTHHLPPCWAQHGYLVERITALRDAWIVSYDPGSSLVFPNDWLEHHDRAVEAMLTFSARLRCNSHTHFEIEEVTLAQFAPEDVLKTVPFPVSSVTPPA